MPVLGMAAVPDKDTLGSTALVVASPPLRDEPVELLLPSAEALFDVAGVALLPAVEAVVPDDDNEVGDPVAVPEFAVGGAAVAVTTPHVGVVCPACTSAGVRSPQA